MGPAIRISRHFILRLLPSALGPQDLDPSAFRSSAVPTLHVTSQVPLHFNFVLKHLQDGDPLDEVDQHL
ncbi:hypothetical protein CVT25_002280 [Psilocybe cyanescens]|uniref:Uncharacterized protein n=1 Tax=Psilocybe cyanescens TaxID=93625 RepID=A0A409X6F5_PSICY|nr:hypothetical protein CVT25_002280 [Psilocybe cyanescens]